jgi:hypothetical protein
VTSAGAGAATSAGGAGVTSAGGAGVVLSGAGGVTSPGGAGGALSDAAVVTPGTEEVTSAGAVAVESAWCMVPVRLQVQSRHGPTPMSDALSHPVTPLAAFALSGAFDKSDAIGAANLGQPPSHAAPTTACRHWTRRRDRQVDGCAAGPRRPPEPAGNCALMAQPEMTGRAGAPCSYAWKADCTLLFVATRDYRRS